MNLAILYQEEKAVSVLLRQAPAATKQHLGLFSVSNQGDGYTMTEHTQALILSAPPPLRRREVLPSSMPKPYHFSGEPCSTPRSTTS